MSEQAIHGNTTDSVSLDETKYFAMDFLQTVHCKDASQSKDSKILGFCNFLLDEDMAAIRRHTWTKLQQGSMSIGPIFT